MERLACSCGCGSCGASAALRAGEGNTIEGVATVFGVQFDSPLGELVIERGAFPVGSVRLPLLWAHSEADPVGVVEKLEETANELRFRARVSATQRGSEALNLLADGFPLQTSIGIDRLDEVRGARGKPTVLRKARLWEVSLVTFGACGQQGCRVDVHAAAQGGATFADRVRRDLERARGLAERAERAGAQPTARQRAIVESLAAWRGFKGRVHWFADGWERGRAEDGDIYLRTDLEPRELARVTLHELAHIELKHCDRRAHLSDEQAEIEATTTAWRWEASPQFWEVLRC